MMKINGNKRRANKNKIYYFFYFALFGSFIIWPGSSASAQESYLITHEDSLALENVIVERYYDSDSTDYTDTTGNALPHGSVTYRLFIDMKPNYSLQVVYGVPNHELFLKTSTIFFNDKVCSAETGFNIDAKKLHIGNVALDSWITMGAASRLHTGILRAEDNDGFSFITNKPMLSKSDGLTKSAFPDFKIFNLDLGFFNNDSTASCFSTFDAAWAALGGIKGPTVENRVLIAQLTTNGNLTYELNVQIGTPSGGYIQFVARNPKGSEIQFAGLTNN
ncbi:MAG: hypothetical protein ACOYMF_10585 [Bacteroidales bacterium]